MLTFIGLGLFDAMDVSLKGLAAIRQADAVYLEDYTSILTGTDPGRLERLYGRPVILLSREEIEGFPDPVLEAAREGDVVLLVGGDPMVSTTHADLRLRAAREGINTGIIHGSSIQSAVCGLSGLQNYRFGRSCSIPFPAPGWFPTTPLSVIGANLEAGLHTLVYLDIQKERCMRVGEAIDLLEQMAEKTGIPAPSLYIGIARAGSADPFVLAGNAERLKCGNFGPPLHVLVVPGSLHPMEKEYLEAFAGL
ncbi:MAG: diphthine synthase [Methanomicrobiaceae archaeon]|nr:diphthine synthase [Methanomicrobiaceae archaeon]